jgi:pilus assembly protein Flp/PilA
MKQFTKWVSELLRNEEGPTAVEYATMLALIIAVCVVAITAVGTNARTVFSTANTRAFANVGS